MTRVAAIDCGTNSIRLLVADVTRTDRGAGLVDVHREMRVVRLGEGVDQTGRLQSAAIDRTWSVMADYTAIIRASGAVIVRMAATSATRDASNRQDFIDMVHRTLGQEPEVITGEEEAELSFRGAVGDLDPADGPFLVVDIGGGSTELVVGSVRTDGTITIDGAVSVDIGCVRLTERVLHSDPPHADEIARARKLARDLLSNAAKGLPVTKVRTMVAVSGSATTVAACARHMETYDPQQIHLSRLTGRQVRDAAAFLLGATTAHRGALGYMHPGRVDVIGAGALLLETVVDLVAQRAPQAALLISEHDILDGLALSLA